MLKNILKTVSLVVALIVMQPTQSHAIGDNELAVILGVGVVALLGTMVDDTPNYHQRVVYREPVVVDRYDRYNTYYSSRPITIVETYPSYPTYHRVYNGRYDNHNRYDRYDNHNRYDNHSKRDYRDGGYRH